MPENFDTIQDVLARTAVAAASFGAPVSGLERRYLPDAIARIPRMPDLVAGGTFYKADGSPVAITPIATETTAIRLLVAATGPMRTALVLTFTGTVTIDWGDGTTTTPASGVAAVHQYDGLNAIPCGRPWGVYLITVTGGTVTAIASSSSRDDWGGAMGNIVSYAIKSAFVTSLSALPFSVSSLVINRMLETVFIEAAITSASLLFLYGWPLRQLIISTTHNTAIPFASITTTSSQLLSLDLSGVKVSGDFLASAFLANATQILFNTDNTEIGNINIQFNSLSVNGFVAMFNSLPNVSSKTLEIGRSAAAMALSTEELAIPAGKGFTVTRT